jgi:hypothetical protein
MAANSSIRFIVQPSLPRKNKGTSTIFLVAKLLFSPPDHFFKKMWPLKANWIRNDQQEKLKERTKKRGLECWLFEVPQAS